jgi:hypothetical protein
MVARVGEHETPRSAYSRLTRAFGRYMMPRELDIGVTV